MAQNIWLVPKEPMFLEGRKVVKILVEANGQDKHNERERTRNMGLANAKPVVCVTTGKEFASIREASDKMGISHSSIAKVCRGDLKSTSGHTFKFKGQ